jgi:hypothetical protein
MTARDTGDAFIILILLFVTFSVLFGRGKNKKNMIFKITKIVLACSFVEFLLESMLRPRMTVAQTNTNLSRDIDKLVVLDLTDEQKED